MGGVGAAIGAKTDLPGEFVKKATENVAKGEPGHWAKTAFSDIKGLKGVSRASGILGAPLVVWQISGAMAEDPTMSIYQATAKEGGGFLAGAAAGALIGSAIPIPVVGTVAGLVAGGVVGVLGGEVIDKAWEPVGDAVEDAAGAVVKGLGGLFG
jgi:phage tail tape-measure protein